MDHLLDPIPLDDIDTDFHELVFRIELELESLKGFLGVAEERQDDDEVVRDWLSQVKDLVDEAQEIIERHLDRIARHRKVQPGFWNALKAQWESVSDGYDGERVGMELSRLFERVKDMTSLMKAYGIEERQVVSSVEIVVDPSTRKLETKMVVGLEKDTQTIEDKLISTTGSSTCRVIGIYGVNGLGKTTLAREVFKSKKVADHFDAKAWAFVGLEEDGQFQFPLKDVLESLICDLRIPKPGVNVEEEEDVDVDEEEGEIAEVDDDLKIIKKEIRKILKKKRCLVVLDDLQIATRWDFLRDAVFTAESSSKVVVTACDPAVLHPVDSHTFLHQHRFLNFKEKWELFLKHTGSLEEGTQGFKTKREWERIIQQCAGLPLTILVLAGLWKGDVGTPWQWMNSHRQLFHQEGHKERYNYHDQSTLELEVELVLHSSLLRLQLYRLEHPFQCLLEMTHYPVGREIPTEELFTNWIESERGIFKHMTPETARISAQKCLNELVVRGLIQVVAKEGGNIKYCQLHRVVRDFCIRVEDSCLPIIKLGIHIKYCPLLTERILIREVRDFCIRVKDFCLPIIKLGNGIPLDGLGFVSL